AIDGYATERPHDAAEGPAENRLLAGPAQVEAKRPGGTQRERQVPVGVVGCRNQHQFALGRLAAAERPPSHSQPGTTEPTLEARRTRSHEERLRRRLASECQGLVSVHPAASYARL